MSENFSEKERENFKDFLVKVYKTRDSTNKYYTSRLNVLFNNIGYNEPHTSYIDYIKKTCKEGKRFIFYIPLIQWYRFKKDKRSVIDAVSLEIYNDNIIRKQIQKQLKEEKTIEPKGITDVQKKIIRDILKTGISNSGKYIDQYDRNLLMFSLYGTSSGDYNQLRNCYIVRKYTNNLIEKHPNNCYISLDEPKGYIYCYRRKVSNVLIQGKISPYWYKYLLETSMPQNDMPLHHKFLKNQDRFSESCIYACHFRMHTKYLLGFPIGIMMIRQGNYLQYSQKEIDKALEIKENIEKSQGHLLDTHGLYYRR